MKYSAAWRFDVSRATPTARVGFTTDSAISMYVRHWTLCGTFCCAAYPRHRLSSRSGQCCYAACATVMIALPFQSQKRRVPEGVCGPTGVCDAGRVAPFLAAMLCAENARPGGMETLRHEQHFRTPIGHREGRLHLGNLSANLIFQTLVTFSRVLLVVSVMPSPFLRAKYAD